MKHVTPDTFWGLVAAIDADGAEPLAVIETEMTEESTFTTISVAGRVIGEEVACHRTARIQHYLDIGEAVA